MITLSFVSLKTWDILTMRQNNLQPLQVRSADLDFILQIHNQYSKGNKLNGLQPP